MPGITVSLVFGGLQPLNLRAVSALGQMLPPSVAMSFLRELSAQVDAGDTQGQPTESAKPQFSCQSKEPLSSPLPGPLNVIGTNAMGSAKGQ